MPSLSGHVYYATEDKDAPRSIKDNNGEVVLCLCRICGQAEMDLSPVCPGPRKATSREDQIAAAIPTAIKHEEGKHYRFGMSCPNCSHVINVDPYRVDDIAGPLPAPAFHILKKIMRGAHKGHDEVTQVKEILCCAERWKQMLQEDGKWAD